MCGIGLLLLSEYQSNCENVLQDLSNKQIINLLTERLIHRGPDGCNNHIIDSLFFIASVLHIQGDNITHQPFIDIDGNVLLWNGEVFAGLINEQKCDIETISSWRSDTLIISDALKKCCDEEFLNMNKSQSIVNLLMKVEGPYSIIYYHRRSNILYFGRDPFGRRSLLMQIQTNNNQELFETDSDFNNDNKILGFSSLGVFPSPNLGNSLNNNIVWREINVDGIFSIHLSNNSCDWKESDIVCIPWPKKRIRLVRESITSEDGFDGVNGKSAVDVTSMSSIFLVKLRDALTRRVNSFHWNSYNHTPNNNASSCHCPIGVLFSGGIDSLLLAALLNQTIEDKSIPIELINVTFLGPQNGINDDESSKDKKESISPDRLAAIAALGELERLYPTREWRLVHVDVGSEERMENENIVKELIHPSDTHMDLNIGTAFWFASRGKGYLRHYTPDDYINVYNQKSHNNKLLLRVAENDINEASPVTSGSDMMCGEKQYCTNYPSCERYQKKGCVFKSCNKCCLDSKNNMKMSLIESNKICPAHKANEKQLLKMKANQDRLQKYKLSTNNYDNINNNIEVNDTICFNENYNANNGMDGQERIVGIVDFPNDIIEKVSYTAQCKVLLVGIGADEQMAGYGRHRTVFRKSGLERLNDELNKDLARLWKRNLGRDDRCISDHGREAWFPYLDEQVVSFLQSLSLDQIADLNQPAGVGDKLILRNAAKELGLCKSTTELVKRAIQFGTRIAQHTNIMYHGSHSKGKGTSKLSTTGIYNKYDIIKDDNSDENDDC
eukprot:gene8478-11461_t